MSSEYGPPSMADRCITISGQRQKLYLDRNAFYLAIDKPKPEGDNSYRDLDYSGYHKTEPKCFITTLKIIELYEVVRNHSIARPCWWEGV